MDPGRIEALKRADAASGAVVFAVCLGRIYIKVIKARQYGIEEWIFIAATILSATYAVTSYISFGWMANISQPENLKKLQVMAEVGPWQYVLAIYASRITIALFNIRFTEKFRIHKVARIILWVLVAETVVCCGLIYAGCPLEDRVSTSPVPKCPPIADEANFWVAVVLHITADLSLAIVPFPVILKILDRRTRVMVCVAYSLGFLSIANVVSRTALVAVEPRDRLDTLMLLAVIEVGLHVVVAALPGLSLAAFSGVAKIKSSRRATHENASGPSGTGTGESSMPRSQAQVADPEAAKLSKPPESAVMRAVDSDIELGSRKSGETDERVSGWTYGSTERIVDGNV